MTIPAPETDRLGPLIETLYANQRPRVWSLIVTVFGDAVLPRGGELQVSRLQILLGRIGIEPGTIRTALSRLGRDGWVKRRRAGRASYYHLSETAEAETRHVMPQIYALPVATDHWGLHLGHPPDYAALQIGPAAWLAPSRIGSAAFLEGRSMLPIPREVLAPEHRAALALLDRDLRALPPATEVSMTPLDAAAARILLIHRWRRFTLRFPQPVPGEDPRTRVAAAYEALLGPSEDWFGSETDGLLPLPPADATLTRRFQA